MRKYAERINEKITDGETSFVMGNHSMSVQRLESLGRFIIGREGFRVEDNPTMEYIFKEVDHYKYFGHEIVTAFDSNCINAYITSHCGYFTRSTSDSISQHSFYCEKKGAVLLMSDNVLTEDGKNYLRSLIHGGWTNSCRFVAWFIRMYNIIHTDFSFYSECMAMIPAPIEGENTPTFRQWIEQHFLYVEGSDNKFGKEYFDKYIG